MLRVVGRAGEGLGLALSNAGRAPKKESINVEVILRSSTLPSCEYGAVAKLGAVVASALEGYHNGFSGKTSCQMW